MTILSNKPQGQGASETTKLETSWTLGGFNQICCQTLSKILEIKIQEQTD